MKNRKKFNIVYQCKIAYNWIKMSIYWCIANLDIQLSTKPIPNNTPYCYGHTFDEKSGEVIFKQCKYYQKLGGNCNGCGFLGIITDDILFEDQVKMCGVKEDIEQYVSDDYVKYQN